MANAKWTDADKQRMERLAYAYRCRGNRPNWKKIALELGTHSAQSCRATMGSIQAIRRNARIRAQIEARERELIEQDEEAPQALPQGYIPFNRTNGVRPVLDSDLRARIVACGISGGILGDPLPGRSALDKMRSQGEGL